GLLFSIAMATAQSRTIIGKVTDKNGQPIDGASVQIKGSKTGVAADPQGNFKITAKTEDVLIISAINYVTAEVKVGAQPTLNVVLEFQENLMTEVVVTGTGVATSKRKLGIAVESITGDKLPVVPAATI